MSMKSTYDVIVVGCGHAGSEAILAAARMGKKCAVFCLDFTRAASMPCNPSIGGSAKGQIVGEIDAMGGIMGEAADNTYLQIKYLNSSRGPAVQALRTQNDKYEYPKYVQKKIRSYQNIEIIEEEVSDLIIENNVVLGVKTQSNTSFFAVSIVITTGTYLKGLTHVGKTQKNEGRMGESPSNHLSSALLQAGLRLGRLKTGTTPRVCAETLDYSKMTPQAGDRRFLHFSFRTKDTGRQNDQIDCYLTNTNPEVHQIIENNLHSSPMFSGQIKGVGPRYCPSLEDKIVRFSEKSSHHLFIEPEASATTEIYIQGFNTSLPEEVQRQILDSIDGLKGCKMLKPGYAVEYDFVFPDQLYPTLECKSIKNLFFAGQINGTSGYEEAAAQGLIAGMNASKLAGGESPIIVSRETSYIGTMIDDLTSKNIISEPYRMMTARSEHRLLLRQDNAIFRLSELAFSQGLLSDADILIIRNLKQALDDCIYYCKKENISPSLMNKYGVEKIKYESLIKRPEVLFQDIVNGLAFKFDVETIERAVTELRYEGYIKRQQRQIEKLNKFNSLILPESLDYSKIKGLRNESRQKLIECRPKTMLEAQKIAGINPADLMIVMAHVR